MPKTKFQNLIFTLMMVAVMVIGMSVYNCALRNGGLSGEAILQALSVAPLMGVIAFLVEFFGVGRIAPQLAQKVINPKKDNPFLLTLAISALTVAMMCPIMSLIATTTMNLSAVALGEMSLGALVTTWIQAWATNLPMAFFYQMLYAGPLVRWAFRKLFARRPQADARQAQGTTKATSKPKR